MADFGSDDDGAKLATATIDPEAGTEAIPWYQTSLGELVGGIAVCSVVGGIAALTRRYPAAYGVLFVPAALLAARYIDLQRSGPPSFTSRITSGLLAVVAVSVVWIALRIYCDC